MWLTQKQKSKTQNSKEGWTLVSILHKEYSVSRASAVVNNNEE